MKIILQVVDNSNEKINLGVGSFKLSFSKGSKLIKGTNFVKGDKFLLNLTKVKNNNK